MSDSHRHPIADASTTRPKVQTLPVTPGKVAIWLFLATEVMFFTGLIGSYIVLRAGSPSNAYSNLFPPGTDLSLLGETRAIVVESPGPDPRKVEAILRDRIDPEQAEALFSVRSETIEGGARLSIASSVPHAETRQSPFARHLVARISGDEKTEKLADELSKAGAHIRAVALRSESWPRPYDGLVNPLSIDLTAVNTFILICSSVTMVLGLSALQRNQRARGTLYLLATTAIGGVFLGVQVYEYYQLMFGHHYPPGVSASGHFRPSASLFASCFFAMTGFHGAHVAAGVVAMACITLRSAVGAYDHDHHSPVELVGLYWHFVDLVWIILFTVVYLI